MVQYLGRGCSTANVTLVRQTGGVKGLNPAVLRASFFFFRLLCFLVKKIRRVLNKSLNELYLYYPVMKNEFLAGLLEA